MVLRILFIILLVIHGLIHLMGFTKAFKLAEMEQLTLSISKPVGILWLLSTLLFIGAALLFAIKKDWWWIIATAAVVFSQILIILYWNDAKFGTIANVIVLIVTLIGYSNWTVNQAVKHDVAIFLEEAANSGIKEVENNNQLPPLVDQWLKNSGALDQPIAASAYLHQKGTMRTSPKGKWMKYNSEQWFRTQNPGFIWTVKVNAAPGTLLSGKDTYMNGKGEMKIKLLSLIPVVDNKSKETSQGSMVRYMAEIIWIPSAAVNDYFSWEQLDEKRVKVTMDWEGMKATGIYTFDKNGMPIHFEAERYYTTDDGATLETWVAEIDPKSVQTFEGIRIPTKASLTWKLKTGDYHWLDMEVMDIKYNVNE